jgi:activator of HSP90 ATPase
MTPAIAQRVRFSVPPGRLFQLYLDSKQHSAATGAKAVVSVRVGSRFSAFDGVITGTILAIVPDRMIVQSWRSRSGEPTWIHPGATVADKDGLSRTGARQRTGQITASPVDGRSTTGSRGEPTCGSRSAR